MFNRYFLVDLEFLFKILIKVFCDNVSIIYFVVYLNFYGISKYIVVNYNFFCKYEVKGVLIVRYVFITN